MGYEIERKFLLKNELWRQHCLDKQHYQQGYLSRDQKRTVRVRIQEKCAFLTIKGASINNICSEFEYEIPLNDAAVILETLCITPIIEKTRYRIPSEGVIWEIDEFSGENAGLIIAEVELQSPGQKIILPPWIDREVTGEKRFYNVNLIHYPYSMWTEEEKK